MIRFEWDPGKNEINRFKHGIDFETAALVFEDVFCVSFVERATAHERKLYAEAIQRETEGA